MFLSSGEICSKTIRLSKIKDTITFNNSCKTLLLQAECNLLRICDSAWELLLGRDVCSMTREQRKAINIPQGDHNRKPPGTAISDLMGREVEDPHWGLRGVGFSDKDVSAWTYPGRFLVLPENTGLLSPLGGEGLLSLLQMAFLFYATAFLQ